MKKKIMAVIPGVCMAASLIGCGNQSTETTKTTEAATSASVTETAGSTESVGSTESTGTTDAGSLKGKTIGYCIPDTSESFLSWLSNSVKDLGTADGVKVDIADAAGSATTQISQIENFTASGVDLIIVMAVDPTGVTDAIQRAQKAGIKVLVAGSDTGAYDAIMYTDQKEDGKLIAKMGAEWIEKTFPDAKAGSIPIAILEDRSTPEASNRCDGMQTITEQTDKVKVVQTVGSIKTNEAAQSAMENIMQSNPDIKMVLSYNSGAALGVNEFATRSGSPVKDPSKFAVFASDLDEASLAAIASSADNSAVFRGLVKFGSNDLPGDTYRLASKMLTGQSFEVKNPDPLTAITPENAAEFK